MWETLRQRTVWKDPEKTAEENAFEPKEIAEKRGTQFLHSQHLHSHIQRHWNRPFASLDASTRSMRTSYFAPIQKSPLDETTKASSFRNSASCCRFLIKFVFRTDFADFLSEICELCLDSKSEKNTDRKKTLRVEKNTPGRPMPLLPLWAAQPLRGASPPAEALGQVNSEKKN